MTDKLTIDIKDQNIVHYKLHRNHNLKDYCLDADKEKTNCGKENAKLLVLEGKEDFIAKGNPLSFPDYVMAIFFNRHFSKYSLFPPTCGGIILT